MPSRNRAKEAIAKGRKMVTFEISAELNALIDEVAAAIARDQGTCSRTQALERMSREGGKIILRNAKRGLGEV